MRPLLYLPLSVALALLAAFPGVAAADQATGNLVYAWNDTLIDIVGDLVDAGGGARAGKDDVHGYYVVSVGVVPARDDMTKAYTHARLEALRMMNQFINGVMVSGSSSSHTAARTVEGPAGKEKAKIEEFRSVVVERFNGHVNGARVWRQGPVEDRVFVVLLLDEAGLKARDRFRSVPGSQGAASRPAIQRNSAMAGPEASRRQTVEADGFAPLDGSGISAARKAAIRDALRNALEKVNGVAIRGRAGRFGKHVAEIIASQTEGYVSTYDVISEERRGGDYHVKVRAVVDTAALMKDVDLYLEALGAPRFSIDAPARYRNWLAKELRELGFQIVEGGAAATHLFRMKVSQEKVPNPSGGAPGFSTEAALTLVDLENGERLFTVRNSPERTPVYVAPERVAKAASERLALRGLKKVMAKEIVNALADRARKGQIYEIVVRNANDMDLDLFRHNIEATGEGRVVSWQWRGRDLVLNCKYPGNLSQLLDGMMAELQASYRAETQGRRPHTLSIGNRKAVFEIIW